MTHIALLNWRADILTYQGELCNGLNDKNDKKRKPPPAQKNHRSYRSIV
jgi:hypothetical protein